jgi:hypothetical protein
VSLVPRFRSLVAPLAVVLLLLAVTASTSRAGVLVASAPNCDSQSLSQVFLPWLDVANYTAAPGGDFESNAAGWTLADGAGVTAGNESSSVGSTTDANSLALPAGSSATSAVMCVGLGHPDLRVFVRRTGGTPLSTLRVDVNFEDAAGDVQTLTVGHLPGGSSWSLSPQVLVVANLLPLLPNNMTPVSFTFAPDSGSFAIDDLYVDPWRGN